MKMIVLLQIIKQNKSNINLTKTAETGRKSCIKPWMKIIHKLEENQTKIKFENRVLSKKKLFEFQKIIALFSDFIT